MKKILTLVAVLTLLATTSCNNSTQKDTTNDTTIANADNKEVATNANLPEGMENILGEWTLDRKLRDDNGNHIVDGDEEKTKMADVKNTMKFNSDGTCKFETVMDGTYKIVKAEDGRNRLELKDLSGSNYPLSLYIVSITQNELVINTIGGGSGFEIYKRL